MSAVLGSRTARVAVVVVIQLLLVVLAVGGQLSARLTGTEYRLRVAPLDPVDPLRGAYVSLGYPDLRASFEAISKLPDDGRRWVYLPLVREGDHWVGGSARLERGSGPVLRCPRSASVWDPCGLGSYFLSEDRARAAEQAVGSGTATVIVTVDGAGRAVLTDLELPAS